MNDTVNENRALIRGTVLGEPEFSHESHGTVYDKFPLSVPRLSATADRLQILVPRPLWTAVTLPQGQTVELTGPVRSFNNRSGVGNRLIISILARTLTHSTFPPVNNLTLAGTLCKPPVVRRTPLGRDICDLLLAVNRPYGRADYLPCIAWGALAQRCALFTVGDQIALTGRLQSRVYTKVENGVGLQRTAFEVSITTLEF